LIDCAQGDDLDKERREQCETRFAGERLVIGKGNGVTEQKGAQKRR
jgi:hypothetical protein